jgi:acyl-CoA thioesterase FadM
VAWQRLTTQYKQEVMAGSLLHIQTERIEIKRKTIRFVHHMFNSESGDEVATTELVGAYLGKALRKTTELPESVIKTGQSWLGAAEQDGIR